MSQTNNFIQKYVVSGGPLTDSVLFDDGTNVGLGTTSPIDLLTIDNGGLTIKSGNGVTLYRPDNAAHSTLFLDSSNAFEFGSDISMATHSIFNVAVLTGNGTQLMSTTGSALRLSNTPNNSAGTTAVVVDTDAAATTTNLFAIRNNGTEKLTVDSSGNVGIGTTSPSALLDVAGTTRTQNLNITTGGSTTISSGIGTVKMSTANNANNAAWIPVAYNGTTYYVPAWTTNAP